MKFLFSQQTVCHPCPSPSKGLSSSSIHYPHPFVRYVSIFHILHIVFFVATVIRSENLPGKGWITLLGRG